MTFPDAFARPIAAATPSISTAAAAGPVVAAVAARVRAACHAPANRFGAAFFEEHVEPVVAASLALAAPLGADRDVVTLAGYLHDLAAVEDFATLPDHACAGARRARELLSGLGLSPAAIDAVSRCIETHSAPVPPGRGTPEQICLSHADVLAQLARPLYWCHYLYGVRGLAYADGRAWLRSRVEQTFDALVPEAQALGAADRAAVARMLEERAAPGRGQGSVGPGSARGA